MSKDLQEQRRKANKELLDILTKIVEKTDGHLRFSQILAGYGFVKDINPFDAILQGVEAVRGMRFWHNEFNKEPDKVLERVKAEYKRIEDDNV